MGSNRAFFARRLHSLLGVIPMGLFIFEHLFVNSLATKGPEAFNRAAGILRGIPYLPAIELIFIVFPFLFHGLYGLWITWTGSSNLNRFGNYRNWCYWLQRLTGILTLVFVVYHYYTLRVAPALNGTDVSFDLVALQLQNPLVTALYALGLVSALFHFTNGLSTFAITWGITAGPESQMTLNVFCNLIFLALLAIGFNALVAFV